MILNIPKHNIHIKYIMSYYVEAYLSYDDYLNFENTITFIFRNKDEYERLYLNIPFFTNLYVIGKGEVYSINCREDEEISEEDSS